MSAQSFSGLYFFGVIWQKEIQLAEKTRGFHLITSEIITGLPPLPEQGLLHIFIKHTSAALTINENADPSVRIDLDQSLNRLIRENESWYTHTFEGSDDMPAHTKSSIVGTNVSIPISKGRLNLGTWQGIYLCEFRNYGGRRRLVLTIYS